MTRAPKNVLRDPATRAVIARADALLDESGHWLRHVSSDGHYQRETRRRDLAQALWDGACDNDGLCNLTAYARARLIVEAVLADSGIHYESIFAFNDDANTTFADVKALLAETRARFTIREEADAV